LFSVALLSFTFFGLPPSFPFTRDDAAFLSLETEPPAIPIQVGQINGVPWVLHFGVAMASI
jgi:hypothetical protein